jgi:dCMP deaminase
MEPCRTCAMLIISVGIAKVVARKRYHAAQETRDMFEQAGVELVVVDDTLETYENQ